MPVKLKALDAQRVVITGASSGIGLETAREFAKAGAKVLLVARNEEALQGAVEDIRAKGGVAEHVVADVADAEAVERVADRAVALFGGIDTWVNDAGASVYAPLQHTPLDEHRRIFDVNYFGVVHGSLAAVKRMREDGGAIINIGSVLSDMPAPIQGAYAASKHALKGFTDSLRIDLMADAVPIVVTLIKPSAINTPYKDHARNRMEDGAGLPPPIYQPETVARAILHAAHKPTREITVGGGGRLQVLGFAFAPRLSDKLMAAAGPRLMKDKESAPNRQGNLFDPGRGGHAHSDAVAPMPFSLYTAAAKHPGWALGIGVALGAMLAGALVADRYGEEVRRYARPYVKRYVKPALRRFR